MTQRKPVNSVQNIWFDSEQVDANDLTTEQNYNNGVQSAIINNQVGSGTLPNGLIKNVLFDSLLAVGNLDGINVLAQHQPSDTNLGNQLEILLTGSKVAGQKTVKVAIIGLDFNGNLQYETFTFKINEKRYTKKHYTNVLTILFNDFIGTTDQSFNLGGRIIISEASSFTISRDAIMSSQDVQPNLFFRDFFVANNTTLSNLLASALPLYNLDNLNIQIGIKENQIIAANDVTTQIGEKFLATTNNIQKVSLLLSVQNTVAGQAGNLVWAGDLIVSLYALQSTVNCITDIVPGLPIEFSPFNIPLAQTSFNYNSLQAKGITLDGVPQPIDFTFSNTPVANGSVVVPGSYYVVTIKRSGSASQCDILIAAGANQSSNSRVTIFTGNTWVDLPQDDLWYQIYTDAVQVTDGQAYESGQGLIIPKTNINASSNTPQDYLLGNIPFSGTSNAIYTAVLSSTIQKTGLEQDQRTGNDVYSKQQYTPNVELLNAIDISNLEAASEPLVIGTVSDKNIKSVATSLSASIAANLHAWTFIDNVITIKMIDDISDGYRYDQNVLALVSYLTQGLFINAKIIPDVSKPNIFYRIADAEICTMIYGDVDGNGIIDLTDVTLANQLIGANLNISPPLNSQIVTDGYHTTITNGYETLINPFVNVASGVHFQVVDTTTSTVIVSGADGILTANPNNGALATFDSPSTLFGAIANLADFSLIIFGDANSQNNGSFQILSLDATSPHIIDIRKLLLSPEIIEQIFRADIDGNFSITSNDGYLIQNYIDKAPPFPAILAPASKIGTPFSVLRITIDPFTYLDVSDTITNRTDDYPAAGIHRSTRLHTTQDVFINDANMQSHNFLTQPVAFNILPQFTWEEYLITVNGNARFVPTIFTSLTGSNIPTCVINGINCEVYAEPPTFDPGRVDVFIPNNLIIGDGGELLNTDGSNYKIDFEVGTVVLEVPDGFYGHETTINIFDNFVADHTGLGVTRLGFPAMRFADCTTVPVQALLNNQVNFSIAVQSFSPNTNGTDLNGISGPIVDGKIGVFMDYGTGQLTLNFTNLYQDSVLQTLNTKIQVTVFLKKSGFNNNPIFVDSIKTANLLNLNSAFSGAGIGVAPAVTIAGGDLSGFYPNPTVAKIQGNAIQPGVLSSSQNGYVLTWVNSSNMWEAQPVIAAFTAGGDLAGTNTLQIVRGLQGNPISAASPALNNVLEWNGSAWTPTALSGLPPSGSAGGDLSGTYPNPTVAKIQGNTVTSGALTKGQFFVASSTSNWAATTLSGDVSESGVTSGLLTVTKINSSSVPAGGALTTGNVLQVSGASALSYGPVNLAGGANYVTGILPIGNQAAQTLSGDVTGTTAADTVIQITGTGTNDFTSSGTNVNILATETILASSTTAPVKGMTGTATTTDGTTWVNISTFTPDGYSAVDCALSVLALDITTPGNFYRSDVTFTVVRGGSGPILYPVSPAAANIRSNGGIPAIQVILSGNIVEIQVQGLVGQTYHWSIIEQNQIVI